MSKQQEQSSEDYLNDSTVFYTKDLDLATTLLDEHRFMELMCNVVEYAKSGIEPEIMDKGITRIFKSMKPVLNKNWQKVDETKQRNTITAIMSKIAEGRKIQETSIQYLKDNGCFNAEYFKTFFTKYNNNHKNDGIQVDVEKRISEYFSS